MGVVRLSSTIAMVTAGLKCPPEMCPKAKIAASRPRPKDQGTTSRFGAPGALALANAATERYPMTKKMNEPTSSAEYLRKSMRGHPPWCRHLGRCGSPSRKYPASDNREGAHLARG